jgi:hypothetical protein
MGAELTAGENPTAGPTTANSSRVTELPQLLQNRVDRRGAPFAPRSILLFLKGSAPDFGVSEGRAAER